MHGINLHWLPDAANWRERLGEAASWTDFVALATARLDAMQTMQLDRRLARVAPATPEEPVRLAVLSSSTVDHLLPALRVAGLRRSMALEVATTAYGQYAQAVLDPTSELHRFRPNTVLFALDAPTLLQSVRPGMSAEAVGAAIGAVVDRLAGLWEAAKRAFSAQIVQQIPLPVFIPLIGGSEHRLPGSRFAALKQLGEALRRRADELGVALLALDDRASRDGLTAWHDPALWHRAKQEVHPLAAPFYGELVARIIAAGLGRSRKCLVLDLDNTLWGGVIGDDGLAGIKLGQGSARGEAHLAFQHYAKELGSRGIILAVCSKNDEANALEAFDDHPEMALRRSDIACFVANWDDKATNLRRIADQLNIGLDSLVFADDNPAERAVIRRELPQVAVPELPEDPTFYASCIADAGYFEALHVTEDDAKRGAQYQQNVARRSMLASMTDMDGYLRSLDMQAVWGRFDLTSLTRVVQLINKTNQFNLTTQRVSEADARRLIDDPAALTLQVRLTDTFGDNGIVAIVAGFFEPGTRDIRLDLWLMSCRVLGRGLEAETLNLVVAEAKRLGADGLIGRYRPTPKNGMVRDHYERLGFARAADGPAGETTWRLDCGRFTPLPTFIRPQHASTREADALLPT